ncbi:MAG: acetyl/propionyl/methylcrotonyl-CoA carboxylase subunit alpha [Actinomycetota bacterium]
MAVFDTVLVANRGEIAARIMRTLQRMDIESVVVYTPADADMPFVSLADRAVLLDSDRGYLDIDRIVEIALATGSQAVHPGYGFLSENAAFAGACADAGIAFIGAPVAALEGMGDKIAAKRTAIAAGVPVVPGRHDSGMDDAALAAAITDIGFPALIKPSAGGGGKGMVVVRDGDDVQGAIDSARRVARAAFGDGTLLVERYVDRPRHIEVQILADAHGHVVHLGERECTLQRRHQKVVEEAPSPFLDDAAREALCASAVRLAQAVDYVGAGTVEFVVPGDDPSGFAFLEMNTRLQVEHPVTEVVAGLDLVEWQVRVAAGEPLDFTQADVRASGHAIEARVYAEDPARDFLPTGGTLLAWSPPDDLRVDAGVTTSTHVGTGYDPMLAKVIASAPTRQEALDRLREGLARTVALGVTTNLEFLRDLLADGAVVKGDLDTRLVDRFASAWHPSASDDQTRRWAAIACRAEHRDDPWLAGDAWRLGGPASHTVDIDGVAVSVSGADALPDDVIAHRRDDEVWLHARGVNRRLRVSRPVERRIRQVRGDGPSASWQARSPMPGTVVSVPVGVGDAIEAGAVVAVVEAMKMEHSLRAPASGVVTAVAVAAGDQVRLDEVLVAVDQVEE